MLASLVPRIRFGSAVDIGCGGGVQSLHLSAHVKTIVATDINPRALEFASETARRSGIELDLRLGSLYEPIANESFDLIVSNPPFVISPKARFNYRDGGMSGDDISRLLISGAAKHLNSGGWFVALANWMHEDGKDWRERLLPWLIANEGCDAWAVQREVLTVEEYVELWLTDSADEKTPEFAQLRDDWLAYFKELNVESIGFGWIIIHKSEHPSSWRRLEEIRHQIDSPLGDWVLQRFADLDLADQVSDEALLKLKLRPAPGVRVESGVIAQSSGWRFSGAIDPLGAAIFLAADGSQEIGQIAAQLAPGLDELDLADSIRALIAEGFFSYPSDLGK